MLSLKPFDSQTYPHVIFNIPLHPKSSIGSVNMIAWRCTIIIPPNLVGLNSQIRFIWLCLHIFLSIFPNMFWLLFLLIFIYSIYYVYIYIYRNLFFSIFSPLESWPFQWRVFSGYFGVHIAFMLNEVGQILWKKMLLWANFFNIAPFTLWLWLTVCHGIDGPNRNRWFTYCPINNGDFPWQTVSHNQMVSSDIRHQFFSRWIVFCAQGEEQKSLYQAFVEELSQDGSSRCHIVQPVVGWRCWVDMI